MKRLAFSILIVAVLSIQAQAKYSGGSGTIEDPYQIADANDLLVLSADANDYGASFVLTADINMEGQVFTAAIIATDYGIDYSTSFMGTFDGNGYKITNFTINGSSWYLGLFGISFGTIKNLGVEDCIVNSSDNSRYVGDLVGLNYGSISNCYSMGSISGPGFPSGGLVGQNYGGNINNCYSTGMVNGSGGLVGRNDYGSISNCYSTSDVNGMAGLVAVNYGSISNCYSAGTVIGTDTVGGLVGIGYNISNCYSTGAVRGTSRVGGLIGIIHENGGISNCYSTGSVSGTSEVGGLVGGNAGNVSNCYSMGSVSGTLNIGGLVGFNYGSLFSVVNSFWDIQTSGQMSSVGGEGKTTAEMKTLSTFTTAGWDFSDSDGNPAVWFMLINEYPILTWQDTTPPEVNITVPKANSAIQDGITLAADANDDKGVAQIYFCVRGPNDGNGVPIGFEDLQATLDTNDGYWKYNFNTAQLADGKYIVLAKAVDTSGNIGWSKVVPFIICNSYSTMVFPATAIVNKAGKDAAIKFSLCGLANKKKQQSAIPFIYNEDLEIRIYKLSGRTNILQQKSVFGSGAADYQIDLSKRLYITNFQTESRLAIYTVEVWRPSKNLKLGIFGFLTIK